MVNKSMKVCENRIKSRSVLPSPWTFYPNASVILSRSLTAEGKVLVVELTHNEYNDGYKKVQILLDKPIE